MINHFKQIKKQKRDEAGYPQIWTKTIQYTPEIKKIIRDNKGILKKFFQARKKLLENKSKEPSIQIGNLFVKKIQRIGYCHTNLYQARIGKKTFFIKEGTEKKPGLSFLAKWDLPEPQIENLEKMKQLLHNPPQEIKEILEDIIKNSPIKKIEIANWQLGYNKGKNYFLVTDYYEGKTIEKEHVPKNLRRLQKELYKQGFDDINFIWDSKHKKVIIFDVRPRDSYF